MQSVYGERGKAIPGRIGVRFATDGEIGVSSKCMECLPRKPKATEPGALDFLTLR